LAQNFAIGAESAGLKVFRCANHDEALEVLRTLPLNKGWHILVKGSRGMRMESIVQALLNSEGAGG